MDYQDAIRRVGILTQEIGRKLIVAAENEDISALRPLSKQLREIMDILNTITFTDKMMRAAKNN